MHLGSDFFYSCFNGKWQRNNEGATSAPTRDDYKTLHNIICLQPFLFKVSQNIFALDRENCEAAAVQWLGENKINLCG